MLDFFFTLNNILSSFFSQARIYSTDIYLSTDIIKGMCLRYKTRYVPPMQNQNNLIYIRRRRSVTSQSLDMIAHASITLCFTCGESAVCPIGHVQEEGQSFKMSYTATKWMFTEVNKRKTGKGLLLISQFYFSTPVWHV